MKQYLLNALLAITAVFAPAKGMILTSLLLIMLDLITGLLVARKQKIPITSSGLKRTVVKCLIYESAILLGFLTQTYLTGDSIPVSSIVATFVGLTEFISCLENMNELGDNKLLKALLEKIGNITQK